MVFVGLRRMSDSPSRFSDATSRTVFRFLSRKPATLLLSSRKPLSFAAPVRLWQAMHFWERIGAQMFSAKYCSVDTHVPTASVSSPPQPVKPRAAAAEAMMIPAGARCLASWFVRGMSGLVGSRGESEGCLRTIRTGLGAGCSSRFARFVGGVAWTPPRSGDRTSSTSGGAARALGARCSTVPGAGA
jgi:hypothetical protein